MLKKAMRNYIQAYQHNVKSLPTARDAPRFHPGKAWPQLDKLAQNGKGGLAVNVVEY
jgi:hypothetical protein